MSQPPQGGDGHQRTRFWPRGRNQLRNRTYSVVVVGGGFSGPCRPPICCGASQLCPLRLWTILGEAGPGGNRQQQSRVSVKEIPQIHFGFPLDFRAGQLSRVQQGVTTLGNLSKWAFCLTFAGVGLRTNFRDMSKQGLRPFVVGALGEILIACLTLGLGGCKSDMGPMTTRCRLLSGKRRTDTVQAMGSPT